MRDGLMVIPKGKDLFPEQDKTIRAIHWAGGKVDTKMNYRVYFQQEVQNYIDEILK
jgi:hypothetical protein